MPRFDPFFFDGKKKPHRSQSEPKEEKKLETYWPTFAPELRKKLLSKPDKLDEWADEIIIFLTHLCPLHGNDEQAALELQELRQKLKKCVFQSLESFSRVNLPMIQNMSLS